MYNTILQPDYNSKECRAIRHLSAIRDDVKITNLVDKNNIPIGTVEFTKKYFMQIGIDIPIFTPYPDTIPNNYYQRIIEIKTLETIFSDCIDCFIKPNELKQFNGFCFRGLDFEYDNHDKEQIDVILNLNPNTKVYCSDIIDIDYEFRCYINNKEIIAICQYDSNDDYIILDTQQQTIKDILTYIPYNNFTLDIGIINDNIIIIELNDAWAIGLYNGISNLDYLKLLDSRWQEIIK